jgi:2'-5' RNA ligase
MKRRAPPRPALPRYAVAWFPSFVGIEQVEAFRERHDPMAALIPAHLTLVFPFATALTPLQIGTHVRNVVSRWPPISTTFRRAEIRASEFVFLLAGRGAASIVALHDRLYSRSLRHHLRPEFPYEAHITIARNADAAALDAALEQAQVELCRGFADTLREVALLAVDRNGRIDRLDTFALHSA